MALAVFLQLQVISKAEYIEEGINYTFFFIGLIFVLIPILLCYMTTKDKYNWITEPLIEETNTKLYIIFLYARKLYIVLVLTLIKNAPLTQIILISIIHFSTILYIILKKPYKTRIDNIRHLI